MGHNVIAETMNSKDEYDVFISHAWEDKDTFVRRLANLLNEMDVKVWYDEFSLSLGDSLSRSIDKGLSKSKYGIVVISKAFMQKGWTEYELRGLITKEIGNSKVILPIWYGVTKQEVADFSLPLADKIALDATKLDVQIIALRVIKIVKPETYESILRFLKYKRMVNEAPIQYAKAGDVKLKPGDIKHSNFPKPMMARLKLVYLTFQEVLDQTFDEFVTEFKRDVYPTEELHAWEVMAVCYLQNKKGLRKKSEKRELLKSIIAASMSLPESDEIK